MLPWSASPGKPWSAKVTTVDPRQERAHGTHHRQIRAAPQRPVTLADRDVAALIGVLAILAGQVLSGEVFPHMTQRLSERRRETGYFKPARPANLWPGRWIGRLPA